MDTKKKHPVLKIQLGEDGNPEVYAQGTPTEQAALCTAAVAAICMEYPDPAGVLISMMTTAADLMDRTEEVHYEEA